MNTLEIISVNIWQILISLCNLIIIFLILKKFLFAPVRKVIAQRMSQINSDYADARESARKAEAERIEYENQLQTAKSQADSIIKDATDNASRRADSMIADAKKKAELIISHAEADAAAEYKKAQAQIKSEIADVSVAVAEKMLGREINKADNDSLIDSFIEGIGENNDRGK